MWDEIEKYLPMFDSAVLSVTDPAGYPYSIRCHPVPDRTAGTLRLDIEEGAPVRIGQASILCHSHDQNTWNQKIFVLRGDLEEAGGGWAFRPEKFVPSLGVGGPLGAMRALIEIRRNAAGYLKRRGLPRPRITWREIEAVKDRASR